MSRLTREEMDRIIDELASISIMTSGSARRATPRSVPAEQQPATTRRLIGARYCKSIQHS